MSEDHLLDARGLLCPLPVLKVQKRMRALSKGAVLTVLTDDPAAAIDVPHYCAESGNKLVSAEDHETGHRFRVRKV
jgi:tRNA 2-thiouridine synthesizing protein A